MNVSVVEPNRIIRESLTFTFLSHGLSVAWTAGAVDEGLAALGSVSPDVLVVGDDHTPVSNALTDRDWPLLVRTLKNRTESRVLVFAELPQGAVAPLATAGAWGFLQRHQSAASEVAQAVRRILSGEQVFPADTPSAAREKGPVDQLSRREIEVLSYIAAGADNLKISCLLGITERTVRAHVSALYRKLGPENRTQLALLGRRIGITPAQL